MDQDRTEDYSESGGFPEFSFVATSEEAYRVIEEYEIRTTSRFSCYVAKKGFGCTDYYDDSKKLKVMWEDFQDNNKSADTKAWRLEFDGTPYLSLSWKKFDCHHGMDRKVPHKEKRKKLVESEGKKRNQSSSTKKLGCPAKIILREVIKFPEFMISQDTHWYRHESSRKVRSAIKAKTPIGERRIYIYLPKIIDHRQHLTGAAGGVTQRLDYRIKHKIQQISAEGQSNVDEISKELRQYVEHDVFAGAEPPPLTSRRFYPTKTDIRNHLYLARTKQEKFSALTPENSQTNVAGGNTASTRLSRSSRKRKLKDIPASEVDHSPISIYPCEQSQSSSPLLVSCPDHITEVEISSQEIVDATNAIDDRNHAEVDEDCAPLVADRTGVQQTFQVVISEADTCDDVDQMSVQTAEVDNQNISQEQQVPESGVRTRSGRSSNQSRQGQELNPAEQQCEVNDSTVIDNLNLIAQAMETRMLESSQVQTSKLPEQSQNTTSDDRVTMETERTSDSKHSYDKVHLTSQCRNLLTRVRHMTEFVQETSVMETVQNKLLDLVSYMELHVPPTSGHTEQNRVIESEDETNHLVENQTLGDVEVVNVQEIQDATEIVNFEIVL